jgi:hypothetical protein
MIDHRVEGKIVFAVGDAPFQKTFILPQWNRGECSSRILEIHRLRKRIQAFRARVNTLQKGARIGELLYEWKPLDFYPRL